MRSLKGFLPIVLGLIIFGTTPPTKAQPSSSASPENEISKQDWIGKAAVDKQFELERSSFALKELGSFIEIWGDLHSGNDASKKMSMLLRRKDATFFQKGDTLQVLRYAGFPELDVYEVRKKGEGNRAWWLPGLYINHFASPLEQ